MEVELLLFMINGRVFEYYLAMLIYYSNNKRLYANDVELFYEQLNAKFICGQTVRSDRIVRVMKSVIINAKSYVRAETSQKAKNYMIKF